MLNFVQRRRLFFTIAGILIALSFVALVVSAILFEGQALRISIDFKGGTLFILHFTEPVEESAIREVFVENGHISPIVQRLGAADDNSWQVRTRFADTEEVQRILDGLDAQVGAVDRALSNWNTVEPTVGAEVAQQAALAVFVAALAVLTFIWYSFRKVPHPFRYGVVSIVAMLVNVTITLGFFALMGILQGWEADALFLTAVLTVIGFSVQDVIVVFDRIRENIPRHRGESFEMIVNRSVLETVHRSLATQLNAMFVMIAILLFGGTTIKPFIAVMLVGMLSETFTSLCVAVPLLVVWEERDHRHSLARAAA
ncbi:MAG TPA: protein translocase subunit SecF [Anaerolineae bacterium]|nr:protein translocase subunit SecF [Anaerolineae bacterium]HQI83704.1 protein translocase subunit SecF [Anaerolineae bacterium]